MNININMYLKKIGITKSELAKDLEISRPTLNLYIETFESGKKIENERYNIIFNNLFSSPAKGKEQFEKQLLSVKGLIERDKRLAIGELSPEAADIVAQVHNKMVNDMSDDQWDRKAYDFILIFLSMYRWEPIMKEIAGYFSDLNSYSDLSDLAEDSKAYYSYFYEHFRKILGKVPKFNETEFELFLKRKTELATLKEKRIVEKTNSIKKKMSEILEVVEQEYRKNGIEASESEVMAEVARRMGR